jgi:hypothetical protein
MSHSQGDAERKLHSFILRVNSNDRLLQTQSTTNFTIGLGQEVKNHNVKRIVLRSVSFGNFEYNINTKNQVLTLVTGADGSQTQIIPAGQYILSDLITTIQNIFNPVLTNTLTITQDPNSYLLTFAISGGDTIQVDASSTMAPFLGYTATDPLASSVIAQRVPRLNGLTSCFIRSTHLAKGQYHDNRRDKDILTSIQVASDFGQYVYWESFQSELASVNYPRARKLDSTLDFQFLDQNLQEIELNGHNMDIELICYFVP